MKKCKNCNGEFSPSKYNSKQKFCSKECARQHYYKTHKKKENRQAKQWYQKNRDYKLKEMKRYREEHRELFNWHKNQKRFDGLKKRILERDNHKCRLCGAKVSDSSGRELSVHHIDGKNFETENPNHSIKNLITLCNSCHHKLHWWQRKNNQVLETDEDIVRTMGKLIEANDNS